MNVQEVEARIEARITGIEDQESRLGEWLECLRKLDGIAAQWQPESIKAATIETSLGAVEDEELVSEFEAVQESLKPVHEERLAEVRETQVAEDPFDELRRRLSTKSQPTSGSGLLSRACA